MDATDGGTLRYHVTGLSGSTHEVMAQAITAGGIPQRDDPHEYLPGLKVVSGPRLVEMRGNFAALVEVQYGPNENTDSGGGPANQFDLDSSIVEEDTNLDASGKTITVGFDPTTTNRDNPDAIIGTKLPDQTGETQKWVPVAVLRVTRIEQTLPIYAQNRHVGTTNGAVFFFFPAEYWLCAAIRASSSDRGKTYSVTYEFWGNQFGWLKGVVYKKEDGTLAKVDPSPTLEANPPRLRLASCGGGTPVGKPDQRTFNSMTIVRVQNTSDFSRMSLVLPSNIDTP